MFNKESFKTKLEFTVRQWHAVGADFIAEYGEGKSSDLMQIIWVKSIEILWSTRCNKRIYIGTKSDATFPLFAEYITIAFNQLSTKIMATKTMVINVDRVLEQQKLIKEFVEDMANEFEENFIADKIK
jgi:hypothetical protein